LKTIPICAGTAGARQGAGVTEQSRRIERAEHPDQERKKMDIRTVYNHTTDRIADGFLKTNIDRTGMVKASEQDSFPAR
jgi:hypothetical protein